MQPQYRTLCNSGAFAVRRGAMTHSSDPRLAVLWEWMTAILSTLYAALRSLKKTVRIWRVATTFPGPKAMPLIGNIHEAIKYDPSGLMQYGLDIGKKYPIGRYWIGPLPVFFVCEPRDIERILIAHKSNDKPYLYRIVDNWLGSGLISSSGELWRRHSKIIAPTFHLKVLESFVPIYNRHADVFVRQLDQYVDGKGFDIMLMAERLSLGIICEAAMGVNMNEESFTLEYVKNLMIVETTVIQRAIRPWLHTEWAFRRSELGRQQRRALDVVHGVRDRVIADRRRTLHALLARGAACDDAPDGKKRQLAFLDHLLLSVRDGAKLSDKEIADEVDTFMFAGHDTNSMLISCACFELARYQTVQDKIVEELESVFDPSLPTIEVSPEDINKMAYLEMTLKETLRLHPPVPIVARVLKEDVPLASCNLVIPEGAQVGIGIAIAHLNPEYFPDPMKFEPERFLPEEIKARNQCAFLPFAAGQRSCVGKRLAMMEAKAVMAKILWCFRILPEPGFQPREAWGVTIKPINGIEVRLQRRPRGHEMYCNEKCL